ncbi:hypothetical protein CLF_112866 [Clonorchis sinensis]|uniref:Uncharacterized protein n=1 Tax=Clonorchis sinensis TaxID=79923 RepID=G7YX61_CLOSI|nr:hypothetical protein CLF_112866 [Clonorchis sinensis]
MLSLRLAQPLRPPKPLTEEELEALRQVGRLPKTQEDDPVSREILLSNSGINVIPEQLAKSSRPVSADEDPALASSATLQQLPHESRGWFTGSQKEPFEEARRIPGLGLSTIERHRLLGLHPNEYSIQGATFRLAPNATPGIELSLTCTARNVLPGDTTFLGMNGTVTRTRFVVSVARGIYAVGVAFSPKAVSALLDWIQPNSRLQEQVVIVLCLAHLASIQVDAVHGVYLSHQRTPPNGDEMAQVVRARIY